MRGRWRVRFSAYIYIYIYIYAFYDTVWAPPMRKRLIWVNLVKLSCQYSHLYSLEHGIIYT